MALCLSAAAVIYHRPLINALVSADMGRETARLGMWIDKPLPADLPFRDTASGQFVDVASLFRNGGVLMLYSGKCSPCRNALRQVAVAGKDSGQWPPFFVLMRNPGDTFPDIVPPDHVLMLDTEIEHPFESSSTPVFWKIDSQQEIESVEVGYYDVSLASLLESLP